MSMFRVVCLEETTSTNDEVKRALEAGEMEGLVVRAHRQVAGYGRQGRTWTSPEGGLYCSLLLRPQVEPARLPTLSLVVGLAVRQALVALLGESAARLVQIKWPNDVVLAQGEPPFAKLCGISCEAHAGGVCVGVGVNVQSPEERPAVGGKNRAAYVADLVTPASDTLNADALLDAFLAAFEPCYQQWVAQGIAPFLDEYNTSASLTGRFVQVVNRTGEPLAAGTVVRLDETGALVLRDATGTETRVFSGEAHIAF